MAPPTATTCVPLTRTQTQRHADQAVQGASECSLGQPHGGGGGRLQPVLMRHPPPAICQNLWGGGMAMAPTPLSFKTRGGGGLGGVAYKDCPPPPLGNPS